MSETTVLPLLRVLANGMDEKNNKVARVTILLSPAMMESGGFEIKSWPSEAAKWLREQFLGPNPVAQFRLTAINDGSNVDWKEKQIIPELNFSFFKHEPDWTAIDVFWKACIEGHYMPAEGWGTLSKTLSESLKRKPDETELSGHYSPQQIPAANQFDHDGALIADYNPNEPPKMGSVTPIKHADLAVDEERRRALRIMKKLLHGPNSIGDNCQVQRLTIGPEQPVSGDKQAFNKKLREFHWQEYSNSVKNTACDRKDSVGMLEKIRAALHHQEECNNLDYSDGDHHAIPHGDKAHYDASASDRASYVLGTWLQRRSSLRAQSTKDGIDRPDIDAISKATEAQPPAEADNYRLAVFHALQDDPVLSRLFCLVVDAEFNWPEEPVSEQPLSKKPVSEKPTYWHLWFGSKDQDPTKVIGAPTDRESFVATAARRFGNAFWPVSAFEAGIGNTNKDKTKPICNYPMIEQEDGMWRLGAGCPEFDNEPTRAPRYDLISLDVRRSVDSKRNNPDRGERQITSGLTVLDRGRVCQILREIALADRCAKREKLPMVLHAEDLTVGRRIDIAAVMPGAPIREVTWRSLMHRYVSYNFGVHQRAMSEAMRALVPGASNAKNTTILTEGSFQVAARHMPRIPDPDDKNPPKWDVAADEAIYTWDGTPAAVLTDAGQAPAQRHGELPYKRRYSLNGIENTDMRPPPLRYGVPYLLSMRSVFAGGGSPPSAATKSYHSDTFGRNMLPASRDKASVAPRRFLRHESILAPTLLLPHHVALRSNARVGFEQLDQAIVRSRIDTLPPIDKSVLAPDGSSYIPLSQRLAPDTTMRVFIAPEASFEDVVKHGCLDGKDPAKVLRGGLTNVAYQSVHRASGADGGAVSGFPNVVTERREPNQEDGGPGYRRFATDAERAKSPKVSGIPVFEVGGRHSVPEHGVGWLPDPAAHHFSLRARVRGSNAYLPGELTAALYSASIVYPNALPLVIEIKKGERKRPAQGDELCIVDLAGGAKEAPLAFMNKNGQFGGASSRTTAVRLITLWLLEGEDFDLEVACLPTCETLAHSFSMTETLAVQWAQASDHKQALADMQATCKAEVTLPANCKGATKQPMTGIGGYAVPGDGLITQCANKILSIMTDKWPIEEVAAVTSLRVCHAVNRPSLVPILHDVNVRRPASATQYIDKPESADSAGAKTLLLTGRIALDLEQSDAFEILAETTGTGGKLLDDPSRARSAMSRRTGRWPTYTTPTGGTSYIVPEQVFGFSVDTGGRVDLPRERVTLLRVDNLPVTRAIGEIVPISPDAAKKKDAAQKAAAQNAQTLCGEPRCGETAASDAAASAASTAASGAVASGCVAPQPAAAQPASDAQAAKRPADARAEPDDQPNAPPPAAPLFFDDPLPERSGPTMKAIDLGLVHAWALTDQRLDMTLAKPNGTEDACKTTRTIRLALPYTIADTRARAIRLQVRALSRFAEAFETAPMYDAKGKEMLRRRQPLASDDQSTLSNTVVVWSDATVRPAACEPLRPEPTFAIRRHTEDADFGRRVHHVERRVITRLYLQRGWFSSGEGERLGIVLWPPRYFDETQHIFANNIVTVGGRCFSIAGFDDKDLGKGGSFITRWGGDPIRKDERPQDAVLIPTRAFADAMDPVCGALRPSDSVHEPEIVDVAQMPVPAWVADDAYGKAPVNEQERAERNEADRLKPVDDYLAVSLLTYKPCFDIEREQWYVDVDLLPSCPSEPFVRFGLVRYQKHAIDAADATGAHLQVSLPATVTMPLLPSRRLSVETMGQDLGQIAITMRGPGSVGIKDLQVRQTFVNGADIADVEKMAAAFDKLQRPWMRVWLFREEPGVGEQIHRTFIGCNAERPAIEVQARPARKELVWEAKLDLPEGDLDERGRGMLVAYVEEVDRRMPASYSREPVKPAHIFDESTFVDSGPRFSARVPLMHVKAGVPA
ncbi:hypothetical protein [Paraburkholderia sp. SIMBA_030]|uniref:hypothetical protein n=1 Tax=Paraburkholderia sp. SIMBA_030 TaxID=3085773 RepID=UPI003979D37F